MQTRALIGAISDVREMGKKPNVDIMVPLVSEVSELDLVRSWIEEEVASVEEELRPSIGTMIETPRAAITAEQIAKSADFFSFGTNDLTQLVFGFSRDDIESRVIGMYVNEGILSANPFETLDVLGVGDVIKQAISKGRKANPGLEIGVCGEHGGDPTSIQFLFQAGVNYISCSPFRIPIARLAAAQAVLSSSN
jgi:pyruvate,orthophosphate dikinase